VTDGAGELGEHRDELADRLLRTTREHRPVTKAGLEEAESLACVALADLAERRECRLVFFCHPQGHRRDIVPVSGPGVISRPTPLVAKGCNHVHYDC
jgi:hypothetical protein